MPRVSQRKTTPSCRGCCSCTCDDNASRLRFERRRGERSPHEAPAIATFRSADGLSSLTHVELEDISPNGVGLRCPVEVADGAVVTLFGSAARVPLLTGTVVRCEQQDGHFRVGLQCRTVPVAA